MTAPTSPAEIAMRRERCSIEFSRYLISRAPDQASRNDAGLLAVSAKERPITDDIDQSWYALREPEHFFLGASIDDFSECARNAQAVLDVLSGFLAGQRFEVVTTCNALCKLPKIVSAQKFTQLRLTDKDYLQQLLFGGFEIGE